MADTVLQVAVPARLPAVGALRRAVDDFLDDWVDPDRRSEIVLAVSELSTNAIQALKEPGSEVMLRARNLGNCIEIEIVDAGPGFVEPVEEAPDDAEHGRGLRVVQALADEFTVDREDGRTTVRCAFSKRAAVST